jgi:hypothetical protein
MSIRKSDKHQLLTQTCTNQIISWLGLILSTFGAWTNHGQTQTHKIHHGPDLGESGAFPLIVYFVPAHKTNCHFVLGLLSGSLEIPKIRIPATLKAHNVSYRPLIEVRYEAKL